MSCLWISRRVPILSKESIKKSENSVLHTELAELGRMFQGVNKAGGIIWPQHENQTWPPHFAHEGIESIVFIFGSPWIRNKMALVRKLKGLSHDLSMRSKVTYSIVISIVLDLAFS